MDSYLTLTEYHRRPLRTIPLSVWRTPAKLKMSPTSAFRTTIELPFLDFFLLHSDVEKKESRMRRSVNSKIICDFMDPSLSTKVSKLCQHLHFNSFRKESRRFTYSWRMNRKRVQNDDRKKGLQRSKNLFVKWCVAFDAFLHFLNH